MLRSKRCTLKIYIIKERSKLMFIKPLSSPQNEADKAFNLAVNHIEVYKDQYNEAYALFNTNGHNSILYFSNRDEFRRAIIKLYTDKYQSTIRTTDVNTALEALIAQSEACNEICEVATRIYQISGVIYYDLFNDNKIVRCDKNGVSIIEENELQDMLFLRNNFQIQQCSPNLKVPPENLLGILSTHFNIAEDHLLLFAVSLCSTFIPNINHPILIIEGEKGSGKSTMCRNLLNIINPTKKELLVMPKDLSNLVTVLSNNYVACFDNIGSLNTEISNILCLATTGGTLSKRRLYTDNSEVSINIRRIVVLNGLSMQISQSDLMDRAIMLYLDRISEEKRRTELNLNARFEEDLPDLLGSIFNTVSKALSFYNKTKFKKLPRMADFCAYGYCLAESIEKGLGEKFVADYSNNIRFATESIVGDNPVLECIKNISDNEGYWCGSMTELLQKMRCIIEGTHIDRRIPANFPKTPSALSRKLNSYQFDLKTLGIEIVIGRSTDRYVEIGSPENKKIAVDIDDTDDDYNIF